VVPIRISLEDKNSHHRQRGQTCGQWTGCVGPCRGSCATGRRGQAGPAECPLTPRAEAQLEEVVPDVDVVDLDEEEEEVEGFGGHPRQGAEKAGMQQGGGDAAEPLGAGGQRRAQQEAAVEQEQRGQEVHVDPGRGVPPPLPARAGRAAAAGGCLTDGTALHGMVWHGVVKRRIIEPQNGLCWKGP